MSEFTDQFDTDRDTFETRPEMIRRYAEANDAEPESFNLGYIMAEIQAAAKAARQSLRIEELERENAELKQHLSGHVEMKRGLRGGKEPWDLDYFRVAREAMEAELGRVASGDPDGRAAHAGGKGGTGSAGSGNIELENNK